jgi:hypothetical protein
MTEYDILQKIASNFSERKSSAALSNYLVLGNNIKYVNELLKFEVHVFAGIHSAAIQAFESSENLTKFRGTFPFVTLMQRPFYPSPHAKTTPHGYPWITATCHRPWH